MFKSLLAALLLTSTAAFAQRVEVSIPSKTPLHGHLILVFSKDAKSEPRMQMQGQYALHRPLAWTPASTAASPKQH